MARDSERYKVFNVAILRDSWVLEEIEKDAAEHQMPGHVNKLLALRITEYYRLMKEGKISAALVSSRDGVGATNGNTATAEQTALPSVHESTAWSEATQEERRDIVGGLLMVEGLIYDLERQTIIGLIPKPSVLPVLALGLEKTGKWEQRDRGLWLCSEYWPPKRDLSKRHLPPPAHPSLSPAQREEAIRLLQEPGMSIRKVANILGVSREAIHRLAQQEGIELQTSQKLTPEQRDEAFLLLDEGQSLRQTAKRFGITPESLRRLAQRHKQA